jgi:hypothetical protein
MSPSFFREVLDGPRKTPKLSTWLQQETVTTIWVIDIVIWTENKS